MLAFGLFQGFAQSQTVKGKITDENNNPLAGATVTLKGTTTSTTTDASGNFQIATDNQVRPVLVISYIGYLNQEYSVKGGNQVSIRLEQDSRSLGDVVVVGYGVQKKSDVTGASSSVTAKEIAKRPLTRLEQALQGTTSGVYVISPNGQPGQGLRVKIRGANSITGSTEPLYVIDGVIGSGSDVNVNDVQSIEILKDAASTAIYGSRGSNGVVLITTKSGSTGRAKIGVTAWVRHDQMPKELDLMGPYDFARSVNAQFEAQGSTAAFTDQQLADFKSGAVKGTDWQKALHTTAWVQNYQVDLSGGSEAVRYYFSASYLNQPGLILNQWYQRPSFRGNVDIKANDRLSLKFNLVGTVPQSHNNDYGGGLGDPFNQAVEWDPTSPIKDANGDWITHSKYASIQFNPIAQASSQDHDDITTNIQAMGQINYRLLKDLTFTSTNVYSISSELRQHVDGPGTSAYDSKSDNAQVYNSRGRGVQTSNYLTYKHKFGDHSISATALFEFSSGQNTGVTATSKRLSTYYLGYYNLSLGSSQTTGSSYSEDALVSYMGRVYYSYKDKYDISASIRTDGSSHLVQKYATFPSVGVAWNVRNEEFMERSNVFSALKIRASYGQTGNQAVAAYSTIPQILTNYSYNNVAAYYYSGQGPTSAGSPSVATYLGPPVDPTLQWENKATFDAGIDAGFLNGRLTLVIDAYTSKVTNLLYNQAAPQYWGGSSFAANVGSLTNKGIEFAIGGTPISTPKFTWTTNLNISMNRNKVLSLGGQDKILAIGGNNTYNAVLKVGDPLGEFYGYKFLGTWKSKDAAEAALFGMAPGDARYDDLNGDHAYTADDYQELGNATPKYTFGFINDLNYGNFTFSFMFQGQHGGQVFSQTLAYLWGGLGDMKNATTIEAVPENLWSPDHETNNPAWSSTGHNYNGSSRYVYDASFAKLKNISLTYRLPQSLLGRSKITNFEVYISAQNIWTITSYKGYDPEIDQQPTGNAVSMGQEFGIIPNPKSVTFGLRCSL